jgi:hypothetical protein
LLFDDCECSFDQFQDIYALAKPRKKQQKSLQQELKNKYGDAPFLPDPVPE